MIDFARFSSVYCRMPNEMGWLDGLVWCWCWFRSFMIQIVCFLLLRIIPYLDISARAMEIFEYKLVAFSIPPSQAGKQAGWQERKAQTDLICYFDCCLDTIGDKAKGLCFVSCEKRAILPYMAIFFLGASQFCAAIFPIKKQKIRFTRKSSVFDFTMKQ